MKYILVMTTPLSFMYFKSISRSGVNFVFSPFFAKSFNSLEDAEKAKEELSDYFENIRIQEI